MSSCGSFQAVRGATVKIYACGAASLLIAQACFGAITINKVSSSDWAINNGSLSIVYNPGGSNITSVAVDGIGSNILDPADSQIYDELSKSGLGSGTTTASDVIGSNYIDFYTTTQSNSTNAFTYQIHYVMYNNDPAIQMYEVVQHSATDIAGSYGQGQFLMRVNPTLAYNTYQYNTGIFNQGATTATLNNYSTQSTVGAEAGRTVQDATTDLTGSGLPGDFGTNFYTKYDYSSYTQFWQGQTEYGPQYAISTIIPSTETLNGGPTKQNLMFTNNILMAEFNSGHYGDSAFAYTPPQGVNSSRLYGPYVFRITTTNGESGSQLYNDAITTIPTYQSDYNSEATLVSDGYVPTSQRGSLKVTAGNSAGWSSNVNNNEVVLSDNQVNFQDSNAGYQYWAQLSSTGTATLSNVVPGTYRMSLYELGQWGETRIDNVQVVGGKVAIPQNVKFTPENFGTSLWTIGTPNRSDEEFLNGHNASGQGVRQFYGSYNYWAEEAALGNNGKVVYYATADGTHAATNNPNDWIANQWNVFDPGMYDASNGTSDNYKNIAPAYVGNPATYTGSPWEVHFTTTAAQTAGEKYVVLSVGLASVEASLIVTLNGNTEIWHSSNATDAMVRSGDSGIYQMLVFQWPVADLLAAGSDDEVTFGVSQTDGDEYDALRMELATNSASPTTTGWYDYDYITGSNTQVAPNDATGLPVTETFAPVPEPASVGLLAMESILLLRRPRRRRLVM